jgi:hypothetical protein
MKAYGGAEIEIQTFLTSALDQITGQLHCPTTLTSRKSNPSAYWIGDLVGTRASGEAEKVLLSFPKSEIVIFLTILTLFEDILF